jgi:hypothetical protein
MANAPSGLEHGLAAYRRLTPQQTVFAVRPMGAVKPVMRANSAVGCRGCAVPAAEHPQRYLVGTSPCAGASSSLSSLRDFGMLWLMRMTGSPLSRTRQAHPPSRPRRRWSSMMTHAARMRPGPRPRTTVRPRGFPPPASCCGRYPKHFNGSVLHVVARPPAPASAGCSTRDSTNKDHFRCPSASGTHT